MKLKSVLYSFMAMGLILSTACKPELVRPEEIDTSSQITTNLCQHPATVVENECGLYLELENGHKIFVRDSKDVDLSAGMALEVGYSIEESSNSHNGQCGAGCSSGSCGSSSNEGQADALQTCMAAYGVKEGKLSCITVVSSDENGG